MQSIVLDIIKGSDCWKSALEEGGRGNIATAGVPHSQGIKQEAKSGL